MLMVVEFVVVILDLGGGMFIRWIDWRDRARVGFLSLDV